ncbi:ATP-binding cassette subfamily B protein [Spirosoma oryzae]|uniref:ATP-binding cassette subfamily B protein n=1 Tax=Spirosoma oryzae TaxID=1469603 RepID=A0A2T0SRE6_9BACT|nr:peptidase domain-containing ABC transporter [Spirosoma oryzae]PRY35979.1 ATP-binding cassette subfamily B protein [Spirosoma oryzae]
MSFPFYRQHDQMDCGPTCLRMIAKYYGRSFSAQSIRDKSQINREGVSLLGIAEAGETIGLRTLGAHATFDTLLTKVPLPCIVHWDQNHFVVVYEVKATRNWMASIMGGRRKISFSEDSESDDYELKTGKGTSSLSAVQNSRSITIKVADPGTGLLTYSAEEFCQHWLSTRQGNTDKGVVLLLEPTPAFFETVEEKMTSYSFKSVGFYLITYKRLFVQLLLGVLATSGLQLLFPFLTQSIVDVGINTQNLSFIYLVLTAQLVMIAGRLSIDFIRSWILLHISSRVNLNILSDFFIKLMNLPLSFFDTKKLGDIMQRIGDHNRIQSFLTGQTLSVFFSIVNLLIFGVVLLIYNRTIFLIFGLFTLLYVGWVSLFLRQRRKLDALRFDLAAKNQNYLVQFIQGMQDIKLANAERPMRWGWERIQIKLFGLQTKGLTYSQIQQFGTFALNESKNVLITCLAAKLVIDGQLTLGGMLAMQYVIGQLNAPIDQLVGFVQGFQDAKLSLERLNEIHTLADEQIEDGSATIPLPLSASLHMVNLSFRYPGAGNELVLEGINLTIPSGTTTAIVGMSGSGKTTLLKLLLRFYEPFTGEIRLGASTLRSVNHSQWRSQCGVVMQDGALFSDTIARNIAVGDDHIDRNRLTQAVRMANLQEFIDRLPAGINTKIGAEGNGISQGQRQRILIARAVYKDPQFIFFDEATNALDANNETDIVNNLQTFFASRTVLIVAHRLSTVRQANKIIVLGKGKIIETGSHEELIRQQGAYWQLVKNQLEVSI